VTPPQRHELLVHLMSKGLSGRAACRWMGWSRRRLHYRLRQPGRDRARVEQMRTLARRYPRFGYRRVAVLAGISSKRAWRLWQLHDFRLGIQRSRRRRRVASDPRPHRAERLNHVWTYDILHDRLASGRSFKTLSVLDEFSRECLAIQVGHSMRSPTVVAALAEAMRQRGAPEFLRSDNGSEFTATAVMRWLQDNQVGPSFIEPGRPWQNGYVESFHGKFRDECLNREWFSCLAEATAVIEQWRQHYNTERPHSALGYRTPAQAAAEALAA
jgi:putative transposase